MSSPTGLRTERLLLRRWTDVDRAPFAALNRDPDVMEYYPSRLNAEQSSAFVDRIESHFDRHGWGLWAVETLDEHRFVGYVGLWTATFDAPFTPAVEVGWRLSHAVWGRGFAPEAARMAMTDGFGRCGLDEIVSFTATTNRRSQRVMQKLGMRRDPGEDFDHPLVAPDHQLRRHVLYRQDASSWHPST